MKIDQIASDIKRSIAEVGQSLRPDQDWIPVAFLLWPERMEIVGFDPRFLNSTDGKEQLAHLLAAQARDSKCKAVAFIVTAWFKEIHHEPGTPPPPPPRGGIANDPDRQEQVLLCITTINETVMFHAPIIRHRNSHPTLGPWKDFRGARLMENRFTDRIEKALRKVHCN